MDNMFSYLDWAKDQPFLDLPFNEIDNIIFTQLVHLPLKEAFEKRAEMTIAEAAESLDDKEADRVYEILLRRRLLLLRQMADAPRYRDLKLYHYVDEFSLEDEKQFCAMSILLPNGIPVIAYRGTDLTLVGWKEDLNMSYVSRVPAQLRALEYLEKEAERGAAPLVLVGHSKGGNLALFAAVHASPAVQQRIMRVYTNDGPGLSRADMEGAGYRRVRARVVSFLPQSTVVGILLHQHKPYIVVKSRGLGPFQHDAFSWEVQKHSPRFRYKQRLSQKSVLLDRALDGWLEQLSLEDRRAFIDGLYQVLTASGSRTLGELMRTDRKGTMQLLRASQNLPDEVKRRMRYCIKALFAGTWQEVLGMAGEMGQALRPAKRRR